MQICKRNRYTTEDGRGNYCMQTVGQSRQLQYLVKDHIQKSLPQQNRCIESKHSGAIGVGPRT